MCIRDRRCSFGVSIYPASSLLFSLFHRRRSLRPPSFYLSGSSRRRAFFPSPVVAPPCSFPTVRVYDAPLVFIPSRHVFVLGLGGPQSSPVRKEKHADKRLAYRFMLLLSSGPSFLFGISTCVLIISGATALSQCYTLR